MALKIDEFVDRYAGLLENHRKGLELAVGANDESCARQFAQDLITRHSRESQIIGVLARDRNVHSLEQRTGVTVGYIQPLRGEVLEAKTNRIARVGERLIHGITLGNDPGQRRDHGGVPPAGVGLENHGKIPVRHDFTTFFRELIVASLARVAVNDDHRRPTQRVEA